MKRKLGLAALTAIASLSLASSAVAASGSAEVTLDKSTLAFGTQNVNTASATQTVQLGVPCLYVLDLGQYGGIRCSAPGRIDAIEATGDFAQVNDCPLPITNSSTDGSVVGCTVTVTFEPTAAGAREGALNFSSYGDADAYSVALSGTGAVPPPVDPGTGTGNNGGNGGSGDGGGKADAKGQAGSGSGTAGVAAKCKKPKKGKKAGGKKCKKRKARR